MLSETPSKKIAAGDVKKVAVRQAQAPQKNKERRFTNRRNKL